jgi:flagellum-specific peptidoglycan hydrolase FlgJ
MIMVDEKRKVSNLQIKKPFFDKYYQAALDSQKETGVPAMVTLAQAALESGWGKSVKGNNMFGIKADGSWKGAKLPVTTHETLDNPNMRSKFPKVISVVRLPNGKYSYTVVAYFREYATIADSFIDHGQFLKNQPRYAPAFAHVDDAKAFAESIAQEGYATGTNYADTLKSLIDDFNAIKELND